jgi:hypothetical protein
MGVRHAILPDIAARRFKHPRDPIQLGKLAIFSPTKPRATRFKKSSTKFGRTARARVFAAAQSHSRSSSRISSRSREAAPVRCRSGHEANSNNSATRTPDGETYDNFAARIAAWLAEQDGSPVIAVTHGIVTRVMRGLYAGLPRATALSLPVPQDRIFHLAGGTIAEIEITEA